MAAAESCVFFLKFKSKNVLSDTGDGRKRGECGVRVLKNRGKGAPISGGSRVKNQGRWRAPS